ncbi:MAG TPA: cyclic nucleotide-binding domain-containing protein, partial [Leptospiraceae bacterium]|nr:cyclic nucleotide-binding domain-containing protein [Leptospiraceae bacterium]
RALLNGAMEPMATAVVGILLLVLGRFHAPPIVFASLTLAMCLVWIGLALRIKKDYLRALVANLNSRNIDLQRNAFSLLSTNRDLETREILLAALSSNDEDMALFALELLDHPDLATALRLSAVLPHTTPRLKTALLGYLGRAGFSETRSAIRTEVSDSDGPVRAAAVRALSLVGSREDVRSMARLIKDTHANVAAEAVIAQLTRPGGQRTVGTKGLDRLLRSREEPDRFQAARILREVPLPAKAKSLVRLMEHSTADVRNEAVRAMGMLKTREALRLLAAYLREDDVYLSAKEGLLQYGESALSALHAQLAIETEAEAKISIVACIGEISSLRSIPVLAKLIVRQPILVENAAAEALTNIRMKFLVETGQDVSRADEYFTREVKDRIRACYFSIVENIEKDRQNVAILQKASDPTAVLLILDAVQRFARQRLEVALKFLELIGDPRTIRALTADLQFGDARGRAEALEALEGSCTEAGVLVRVLEDDPAQASRGTVDEVLRHILWKNHPPWITSCAVHAAGLLNMKMLEPELFSQLDAPDEMVRINASIALRKLKSKTFRLAVQKERNHKQLERERKKMDTRMERFLFLRSVPLFSEVDGVDLHWINEITHEQKFRARANIFREGDPGESLYIIISGSVRIFKGQKGKELTIDILQERDCFGEMAILDQEPRSASVVAVRNTRLLVINRSDFQRLLIARPRISFALFKTMSRRVREANARLIQLQKVV